MKSNELLAFTKHPKAAPMLLVYLSTDEIAPHVLEEAARAPTDEGLGKDELISKLELHHDLPVPAESEEVRARLEDLRFKYQALSLVGNRKEERYIASPALGHPVFCLYRSLRNTIDHVGDSTSRQEIGRLMESALSTLKP